MPKKGGMQPRHIGNIRGAPKNKMCKRQKPQDKP